jgi:tRNA pseudouridine38-40 synthase
MRRYAFGIQYYGKNYVGWQKQPNGKSVQEEIESCLAKLFDSNDISIVGCGRTDAGVHANYYVFHVDLEEKYELETLIFKFNRILPQEIALFGIYFVKNDFHARFDAKIRTYRYYIHQQKSAFKNDLSLYFPTQLDFGRMNEACKILLGKQDFTSFSKLHTDVKTNICSIFDAKWVKISENEFYFEISADRFLRNMVRAIVGTLLEIGIGKISIENLKAIIVSQNRNEAKQSVPAHGLFLWDIHYEELK